MTASPLEARCEHCHDTGALSKYMDDTLDCHYCDATEKRMALRAHFADTGGPTNDAVAWTAYLFAQRQAAPVAAQPAMPKLPSTPEEVVEFIGLNFLIVEDVGPVEDHHYTMSVHDLLSSFQDLAEEAQPADPDDMAANYGFSVIDTPEQARQKNATARNLLERLAAQPVEVAGQRNDEIDHGEGLEVCEKGDIGADKLPAMAVYSADQLHAAALAEREAIAADYENQANDYINEHATTEFDTGALVWEFGDAGRDYHSMLLELAESVRARK